MMHHQIQQTISIDDADASTSPHDVVLELLQQNQHKHKQDIKITSKLNSSNQEADAAFWKSLEATLTKCLAQEQENSTVVGELHLSVAGVLELDWTRSSSRKTDNKKTISLTWEVILPSLTTQMIISNEMTTALLQVVHKMKRCTLTMADLSLSNKNKSPNDEEEDDSNATPTPLGLELELFTHISTLQAKKLSIDGVQDDRFPLDIDERLQPLLQALRLDGLCRQTSRSSVNGWVDLFQHSPLLYHLQELELWDDCRRIPTDFVYILVQAPCSKTLTSLVLDYGEDIMDLDWTGVGRLTALKHLKVTAESGIATHEQDLFGLALHKLELEGAYAFSDEWWSALVSEGNSKSSLLNASLQHLTVAELPRSIQLQLAEALINSSFPQLQTLQVACQDRLVLDAYVKGALESSTLVSLIPMGTTMDAESLQEHGDWHLLREHFQTNHQQADSCSTPTAKAVSSTTSSSPRTIRYQMAVQAGIISEEQAVALEAMEEENHEQDHDQDDDSMTMQPQRLFA